MPFQNYLCEATGEPVEPPECIHCALKGALPGCEFTPAILHAIAENQRPPDYANEQAEAEFGKPVDVGVSVTELLGCPRKLRYMQREPWNDKPSSMYWAVRGDLFHRTVEMYGATEKRVVSEQRLFWFFKYQGQVVGLSGQPDLVVQREKGWHILDYKTIKEVPTYTYRYTCSLTGKHIYDVPFRIRRGNRVNCPHCGEKHDQKDVEMQKLAAQPRGSHTAQIQLYAELVEKNAALLAGITGAPADLPIVSAEMVYMDMAKAKRVEVPIWDQTARRELLTRRLKVHLQATPDILRNTDEVWQCDYCPVRGNCEKDFGGHVGKAMLEEQAIAAKDLDTVPD